MSYKFNKFKKNKARLTLNVTPLVNEMLDQLPTEVFTSTTTTFFDPAMADGQFLIEVIARLKAAGHSDENINSRIFGMESGFLRVRHLRVKLGLGTIYRGSIKELQELNMEFDVILGNPPYQKPGNTGTKTSPIWPAFVKWSIDHCKENGHVALIHPSGWRNTCGNYLKTKNLLLAQNMTYLNVNDFKEGSRVFGVATNFDYYVVQKATYENITKVVDVDNIVHELNLNDFPMIPNGKYEEFLTLIDLKNPVDVLQSSSVYDSRRPIISETKTQEHKYPCVYSITQKDGVNCWYSNKRKAHFGIPKVMWSNGSGTYPVVDVEGKYGLMQFAAGIADNVENLESIKLALESDKFSELMDYVKFTNQKYDYRVIRSFKKDFWKEFV